MFRNTIARSLLVALAVWESVAQNTSPAPFSRSAGALSAVSFLTYRGREAWKEMMDRCEEFEDSGKIVRGVDCGGLAVFYLGTAALSYNIGGYVYASGAEYIKTLGVTTFGKRQDSAPPLGWNWTTVADRPDGLHDILGHRLPGDHHSVHYNISSVGLDGEGSIHYVKHTDSHYWLHSSNTKHGVVSMLPKNQTGTKERRDVEWQFGDMAGVKYSYASPGCLDRITIANQNFDDAFGDITYNWAYWAYYTQPADKYTFELQDVATYGTPYLGGYLIAEFNGFGTNYEGSPALHDCWS
ncbi:hypothetical protein KCU91_g3058, partial [Aureobasidium melanogenum]